MFVGMIKKCTITIVLSSWAVISFAQGNKIEKVLDYWAEIKNYQCECTYSFDFPFQFEFQATTTVGRSQQEQDIGFYYDIRYIKTEKNESQVSEFAVYNGAACYHSFKGEITQITRKEKPEAFKDKEFEASTGKGVAPAVHKSPSLFPHMLFEVEKEFKNDTLKYEVKKDTVINNTHCFHFQLKQKIIVKDIYIDSNSLLPVLYSAYVESDRGNQTRIASYSNFRLINQVPNGYFKEKNLLPGNWEAMKRKPRKQKDFIGKPAANWALPMLEGDSIALSQLKGKVVLLEFTATWCGYCWEAAVVMNNLHKHLKENKDIVLLSIFSSDVDNKELIEKFAQKHKIENTILYNASHVGKEYEVLGYPTFFIVGKDGVIVGHYKGFSKDLGDKVEKELLELAG